MQYPENRYLILFCVTLTMVLFAGIVWYSMSFWSERSAFDQRSALRWPLFWSERRCAVTAVAKTPEGVVVGFQIFAWAPK
jgi:TRAP-type C4-dicarboxylate transport system permease small subunit